MKDVTGVIVGRFQVHELHEGQRSELIDKVCALHARVMVFIGLSVLRNTKTNPLDFNARKTMFAEAYPKIEVYYIEDQRSDILWSEKLDREITRQLKPGFTAMLYGSRDSFIYQYKGKHPTTELESDSFISGTEVRHRIANNYVPTADFRAGVISAAYDRWPVTYPTVDIAPLKQDITGRYTHVLLGRKPAEKDWRFIGGFAEPNSPSFEHDARRELREEAGDIEVSYPTYVGSYHIKDWRYAKEQDQIKTLLFACTYVWGRPVGGDDIAEVKWIDLLEWPLIMPEHIELQTGLMQYVRKHNARQK